MFPRLSEVEHQGYTWLTIIALCYRRLCGRWRRNCLPLIFMVHPREDLASRNVCLCSKFRFRGLRVSMQILNLVGQTDVQRCFPPFERCADRMGIATGKSVACGLEKGNPWRFQRIFWTNRASHSALRKVGMLDLISFSYAMPELGSGFLL